MINIIEGINLLLALYAVRRCDVSTIPAPRGRSDIRGRISEALDGARFSQASFSLIFYQARTGNMKTGAHTVTILSCSILLTDATWSSAFRSPHAPLICTAMEPSSHRQVTAGSPPLLGLRASLRPLRVRPQPQSPKVTHIPRTLPKHKPTPSLVQTWTTSLAISPRPWNNVRRQMRTTCCRLNYQILPSATPLFQEKANQFIRKQTNAARSSCRR